MTNRLRWGILGTGSIAHAFAKGLGSSLSGQLAAVGSRSAAAAEKFGEEFSVPHRHASYDALLADESVDAVYIATPHPTHAEWAIKAAEAKKHILVEKPIGLNYAEAMAIVEAARAHDVFLMEAFMYRCHPQTEMLIKLLRERVIGDVRVIHATFSFHWPDPYDPNHRLISNALGGGGILDVGCYCTSMSRLIAGVAAGGEIAEPIEIKAVGHLGPAGTDDYALAVARFPGGILAQLSCGVQARQESILRIDGSEGFIQLDEPWIPARDGGQTQITIQRHNEKQPRHVTVNADRPLYAIEADTVATRIAARQAKFPAMTWSDTLGNMKMLDAWRESIGLLYDAEKPDTNVATITRRSLRRRDSHNMTYGEIPGVGKNVSRLFMGCDNQPSLTHASIMFDDFFERGGNAFDTAFVYGRGVIERYVGRWIRNRNIRDEVVLIAKGAHTPFCTPHHLTREFGVTLERMGLDGVDIYMMHRDNPDVPVGEFVDVMDEHRRAGRMKVFGGSNWTMERLDAANEYAKRKGIAGFGVVSNNFSLARMIEPPWEGCLGASDASWRGWLRKTQIPLLAWSSQARGFFIPGRAAPGKKDDAELVRCWYSDDNFRRLERVNEIAGKRNVLPINIALAYVLNQPFPTFPLIGPRVLEETRTSLPALDVKLSPEELCWLNLEDKPEVSIHPASASGWTAARSNTASSAAP